MIQRESLPARVVRRLEDLVETSPRRDRLAVEMLTREQARTSEHVRENRFHLREAVAWLTRAQDATPDRGVSRGFSVAWSRDLRLRGWQPSYPETTGYIIPTLYDCARYLDEPDLRRRAAEMAKWECEVRLPSGAVMGGTIGGGTRTPAVFNTGQVMLGWLRAAQETGDARYMDACASAADYLISVQEPDGSWRKGNSAFADSLTTTYNSRVGWALVEFGLRAGRQDATDAGERNIKFSLSRQQENGWFADNCLTDARRPLLHTIVYAMEGILGAYDALGDRTYLDAVVRSADALVSQIRADGSLAGRFDASWNGTVEWACLTGCAQLSAVLLRLATATGRSEYRDAARRILTFLKRVHDCTSPVDGLRGGLAGSFPLDGGYGRYEILNWATKFFIDALLLDEAAA
jgi:uncharacterized protein YyaL (SSP411 family)